MKKNISLLPALLLIGIGFAQCKKDKTVVTGRCVMLADPGICTAAITRYYYDQDEQKCKSFVWGGCGEYPFASMAECEECE